MPTTLKFGAKLTQNPIVRCCKMTLTHSSIGQVKIKCIFIRTSVKFSKSMKVNPSAQKCPPLAKFYNSINNNIIDYSECEKDLGVLVNTNFKWNDHQLKVLNKAHQMLGITKRTCHFIIDTRKRRSLYLSLVRSQFEHCISIWRS